MRKILLLIVLMSVVLVSGCSSNGLAVYSSNNLKFSYPSAFKIISPDQNPVYVEQTESMDNIVSLWPESVQRDAEVNFLVKREIQTKQDIENISGVLIKDPESYISAIVTIASRVDNSFTEISNKKTTLSGMSGVDATFQFVYKEKTILSRDIIIFRGGIPYTLEYDAPSDKFDKYSSYFDKLVSGFTLQ